MQKIDDGMHLMLNLESLHIDWPTIDAVLLGVIAGVLLKPVFRAYAVEWPAQYSDVSSVVDSASSRNYRVYLAFRFVPVLLTSALVVGIAEAFDLNTSWAVLALIGVHLVLTSLSPGIWRDVVRQTAGIRLRRSLIHIMSAMLIALAAFIPLWLRKYREIWVPSVEQLKEAFWASLIIGLVFLVYRRLTEFSKDESTADVSGNLKRINAANEKEVMFWSHRYSTSPRFVMSVVAAESINRPRILRMLERLVGIVFRSGSYGIAQMQSKRPVSDSESIRLLCKQYSEFFPSQLGDDFKDINLRMKFAEHNVGSKFVNLALSIYDSFGQGDFYGSRDVDYENDLPVVKLSGSELTKQGLKVKISVSADVSSVQVNSGPNEILLVQEGHQWLNRRVFTFNLMYPITEPIVIEAHSESHDNTVRLEVDSGWTLSDL
ncbi:hypothetical protein [Glutamicibacter arilaitensis]|uniref:hypothetical protein n=1 Tax=Glutamicibacter arilaitensis TaxID=256701 RepID=UPI00384F4D49